MIIDLKNKNALVCGSTQGIGKATAVQLSRSGANVTLLARNEDKLREVLTVLDTSMGQKHSYLVADFSKPDDVATALEIAITNGLHVDILINNTGGPPPGPAHKADTSAFIAAFNSHLICNHILVSKLVDQMKDKKFGRIINVISTSVKIPLKGLGVSNTIRGAVANWSKTLATELASYGITVNNVLPGATKTERLSGIISNKSKNFKVTEEEAENEMLGEIPAGRFALPEELAYAITFLASNKASYITGTNLVVDGGRTGSL
ncbi:MAG: SDR family oxidoreductase [Flavobacteriales bacterium]|nr:SDR family oxidoreductase [Flavobacteriales bacterium]